MVNEKLLNVKVRLKAPKGQVNKFGGYNYRNCEDILEAVKPLLAEYKLDLTISDELIMLGERFYVKATATVTDIEDGTQASTTAYARETEEKKGMDPSQITGSASSYARKYALNGLFCIDDTKDADTYQGGTDKISQVKVKVLRDLIKTTKTKEPDFLGFYQVDKLEDITNQQYVSCMAALEKKKAKQEAKKNE